MTKQINLIGANRKLSYTCWPQLIFVLSILQLLHHPVQTNTINRPHNNNNRHHPLRSRSVRFSMCDYREQNRILDLTPDIYNLRLEEFLSHVPETNTMARKNLELSCDNEASIMIESMKEFMHLSIGDYLNQTTVFTSLPERGLLSPALFSEGMRTQREEEESCADRYSMAVAVTRLKSLQLNKGTLPSNQLDTLFAKRCMDLIKIERDVFLEAKEKCNNKNYCRLSSLESFSERRCVELISYPFYPIVQLSYKCIPNTNQSMSADCADEIEMNLSCPSKHKIYLSNFFINYNPSACDRDRPKICTVTEPSLICPEEVKIDNMRPQQHEKTHLKTNDQCRTWGFHMLAQESMRRCHGAPSCNIDSFVGLKMSEQSCDSVFNCGDEFGFSYTCTREFDTGKHVSIDYNNVTITKNELNLSMTTTFNKDEKSQFELYNSKKDKEFIESRWLEQMQRFGVEMAEFRGSGSIITSCHCIYFGLTILACIYNLYIVVIFMATSITST